MNRIISLADIDTKVALNAALRYKPQKVTVPPGFESLYAARAKPRLVKELNKDEFCMMVNLRDNLHLFFKGINHSFVWKGEMPTTRVYAQFSNYEFETPEFREDIDIEVASLGLLPPMVVG